MLGTSLFDLKGKVATVTGGYRGIGLGIARGLRSAGAEVSIWARDLEAMRPVAEEIGALVVQCDICDPSLVTAAIDTTLAAYGSLDIFVANAGHGSELETYLKIDPFHWREVVDVNLTGVFRTTQAAARAMVAQGRGGKVIVVSSIRSIFGSAYSAGYAAAKAGIESLVRSMAVVLAPYDIQVNGIRAGWFATHMTESIQKTPRLNAALVARVPARRWGEPDELAGIAIYLASKSSNFHTGDIITIDGGCSVQDPLDLTELVEQL